MKNLVRTDDVARNDQKKQREGGNGVKTFVGIKYGPSRKKKGALPEKGGINGHKGSAHGTAISKCRQEGLPQGIKGGTSNAAKNQGRGGGKNLDPLNSDGNRKKGRSEQRRQNVESKLGRVVGKPGKGRLEKAMKGKSK